MTHYRLYTSLLQNAITLRRSQQAPLIIYKLLKRQHLASSSRQYSNTTRSQNNPWISCQCGTIRFQAPTPTPIEKYVCHCRECQKQSASAFGTSAIFPSEGIWPFPSALQKYFTMWRRSADSGNTVECYFCRVCGVRILHRVLLQGKTPKPTVTVRGGCLEGFTLDGAKHIYTRSALVPVPPGSDLGAPKSRPGMTTTTQ